MENDTRGFEQNYTEGVETIEITKKNLTNKTIKKYRPECTEKRNAEITLRTERKVTLQVLLHANKVN